MPLARHPRRMLSAWVPHARPAGAPPMTFGRRVTQLLKQRGADVARWGEFAADRDAWRTMLTSMETPPEYRTLANRRPRRRAAAKVQPAIDRGRRFEALLAHDLREQQRRERAAW